MKKYIKHYTKYYFLLFILLSAFLVGCSTFGNKETTGIYKDSLYVTRIKKVKNNVYFIYAIRNDSLFKIVTYYNGIKEPKRKKLKVNMSFNVPIKSMFKEWEVKNNIIPPCNEEMIFHGVEISKELKNGIDDVWFSENLNGLFVISNTHTP